MKDKGITRHELAELSGVSVDTISRLGRGHNITKGSFEKLALHIDGELFKAVNEDKKLSPNTAHHFHKTLNSILERAVNWGYIPENPCRKVEHIRADNEEGAFLDDEQITLLFELLENEPPQYMVMIKMLVYSGMRRGELKALRWEDLNFNTNVIHIRRELLYTKPKGVYIEEGGKTKSSNRSFQLSQEMIDILKKHRATQIEWRLMMGDKWTEGGWVFTNQSGGYLHPHTITKWFHGFIERHGLSEQWKGVHIHSLRHSNASLMIANGVRLPVIADRLGHANPTVTARVYSHAFKSSDAKAADIISVALSTKKEERQSHA